MIQISQANYAASLFGNGVVTITNGDCKTTDGQVSSAVMRAMTDLIALNPPTNESTGPDVNPVNTQSRANTTAANVQTFFTSKPAGSTSVVLLGETHTDPTDQARAQAFIAAISAANPTLTPTMVVYERGLTYPATAGIAPIRETNLTSTPTCYLDRNDFGMGLSPAQRSMVIAGYITLCSACGNQLDTDRILLLFGARHSDILTYCDYFARHGGAFHFEKQQRFYNNIASNV